MPGTYQNYELTANEARELKQRFLAAQKNGMTVLSDQDDYHSYYAAYVQSGDDSALDKMLECKLPDDSVQPCGKINADHSGWCMITGNHKVHDFESANSDGIWMKMESTGKKSKPKLDDMTDLEQMNWLALRLLIGGLLGWFLAIGFGIALILM